MSKFRNLLEKTLEKIPELKEQYEQVNLNLDVSYSLVREMQGTANVLVKRDILIKNFSNLE